MAIIIISPGHVSHIKDKAGCEYNGIIEHLYCYGVLAPLNHFLTYFGHKTFTVLPNPSIKPINNTKQEIDRAYNNCLKEKVAKIIDLNPDLILELHLNAFKTTTASGTFCVVYPNSSSITTAEKISASISDIVGLRDRGIIEESKFYILRKPAAPSIIIELAYASSEKDRRILKLQHSQILFAWAIARVLQ